MVIFRTRFKHINEQGSSLKSDDALESNEFNTTVTKKFENIGDYKPTVPSYTMKTPTKDDFDKTEQGRDYNESMLDYEIKKRQYTENQRRLLDYTRRYRYHNKDGIYLIESYNYGSEHSLEYFSGVNIISTNSNVYVLTTPIKYGTGPDYNNKNGGLYIGKEYWLYNVSRTLHGQNIHIKITLMDYKMRPDASWYYNSTKTPGLWIWRAPGESIGFSIYNIYDLKLKFSLYADGDPIDAVVSSVVTDMDYYQGMSVEFNRSETIYAVPPGSHISRYGSTYHSDSGSNVDDKNDIPIGTLVFAGHGSTFDIRLLGNVPDRTYIEGDTTNGTSWEVSLFGDSVRGNFLDFSEPIQPPEPVVDKVETITYIKVNYIRPWAIRNNGKWMSFTGKYIDMVIRKNGSYKNYATMVKETDVGQPLGKSNSNVYIPKYGASDNGIRKDGVWKQQGKIGS